MQNLEVLRNGDKVEIAELLCNMWDYGFCEVAESLSSDPGYTCCELCPASKTCKPGHCGFLDWLEAEAKE